jgi:hypothetical protein
MPQKSQRAGTAKVPYRGASTSTSRMQHQQRDGISGNPQMNRLNSARPSQITFGDQEPNPKMR